MIEYLLTDKLGQLKQKGLYRYHRTAPEGFINFSSNDYLSLGSDSRLREAFVQGFKKHPAGASASMLVSSGYHRAHQQLESAFAKALEVDASLIFSSGYAANLAIASLLAAVKTNVLIDKAAHASFYDGLRQYLSQCRRYRHQDLSHLQQLLEGNSQHAVVVTESIFSMSGQRTNLQTLSSLCKSYDANLIIDEAHSFGLVGAQGMGAVIAAGLSQREVPLRVIPFGKALAFQGAIVCGDGLWIEALLQFARSHIYSTAISPALAYGLAHSLELIKAADDRREKLVQLTAYFKKKCLDSPYHWRDSDSAIQQLQLGCPFKAVALSEALYQRKILCSPMRTPTVIVKESGLRIVLNYQHQPEDIDYLFTVLEQCYHRVILLN